MTTSQEFGYPVFDGSGRKPLVCAEDIGGKALQNIDVYRMKTGQRRVFSKPNEETAIVLVQGSVVFGWNGVEKSVTRAGLFSGAYCLHVPRNMAIEVTANGETEILVQSTVNPGSFEPVLYTPENYREETFGEAQFEGKARRTVRTFFDYSNAPYSNMVNGEILVPQGGWSSYPPHHHPQPEVYYYRFEKPQGFGACFIGDNVYTIRDGSYAAIPGDLCHPQVNAPGYPMYYVWMIRHFDGAPWKDRIFAEAHQWLLDEK